MLFVYSDGGPDHRLTYMSVKLSLICLFLKLDLNYLCAGRTASYHSGLARAEQPEEFEREIAKCNSVSE